MCFNRGDFFHVSFDSTREKLDDFLLIVTKVQDGKETQAQHVSQNKRNK